MRQSNYDKSPFIEVETKNRSCVVGWDNIIDHLNKKIKAINKKNVVVVIECYHGINDEEVFAAVAEKCKTLFLDQF